MGHIDIVVRQAALHQKAAAESVAKGLSRHGWTTKLVAAPSLVKSDIGGAWGWGSGRQVKQRSSHVLIMERAYLADRFQYISLGWNGLNGRAIFPEVDDGGARFRDHFPQLLRPWRGDLGPHSPILLIGQVPTDWSVRHINIEKWYENAIAKLRAHGRKIIFRPHPAAVARGMRDRVTIERDSLQLGESIYRAGFVVSFNSNSSVESVLAGVPTITMDRGAMAFDVTGHDFGRVPEEPPEGERERWAHKMAFTQWLPEEIESGLPFDYLLPLVQKEAAE